MPLYVHIHMYISYVYVKGPKEKLSLSGPLHLLSARANVAVNRNHHRDEFAKRTPMGHHSILGTVTILSRTGQGV